MTVYSPAEGVARILAEKLVASDNIITPVNSTCWMIFFGIYQATPDKCVTLRDTGGFSPNPKYLHDNRTVQAIVRGGTNGYNAAYAKASQIKDVLLGLDPRDVGDDHWNGILMMSDLAFVGNDSNNRPMITINFRIIIEPATNALTNRQSL